MIALDTMTRHAVRHTAHCLVGCGIGEILGSAIGAWFAWPNLLQTVLAVVLAFTFGYGLTYYGSRRMGIEGTEARRIALRTDTISIVSMEIIDNTFEWLIPGAMDAHPTEWLFWWSLAASLGIAFILTVPVNRFMLVRFGIGHHDTGGHEHRH